MVDANHLDEQVSALHAILVEGGLQAADVADVGLAAFTRVAVEATAHDILTLEESRHLDAMMAALDLPLEVLGRPLQEVAVSAINGGLLPRLRLHN